MSTEGVLFFSIVCRGVGFSISFLNWGGRNALSPWPGPVKVLPCLGQTAAASPAVWGGPHQPALGGLASVANAAVIPRLVKNLNRRKEGWIPVHSLQIVVGDCRFRNAKLAGI